MMVITNKERVNFIEVRLSADDGVPKIYFTKLLHLRDGKEKLWSGSAQVTDDNLLQRLKKLECGAELEIEIATDWDKENIPVGLIDFQICQKHHSITTYA